MFLDTSGLLCVLHQREPLHDWAKAHFTQATNYLVHDHVLCELVALAQIRGVSRAHVLAFINSLIDSPHVTMVFVDLVLFETAIQLLNDRPDKTYSLCDALSFVIMRSRGVRDALTTDKHFEQEGFRRLLVQ